MLWAPLPLMMNSEYTKASAGMITSLAIRLPANSRRVKTQDHLGDGAECIGEDGGQGGDENGGGGQAVGRGALALRHDEEVAPAHEE